MTDRRVPLQPGRVFESFAPTFIARYGEGSLFVNTVSDWLTLGLTRMLAAKGHVEQAGEAVLRSDSEAVDVLAGVARLHDPLKAAVMQEALGFSAAGTIETTFDAGFGQQSFLRWLQAFEGRDFETCRQLTTRPS